MSPYTEEDVKALTDENNVNGDIIKVVLISQAGSEGLDFKNIRQVHILEPWYNMNRIEQIIGRAIRNCSHKLLPFSKRNVEIFLYGTLLANKKEEAVDLYVYRLAEVKSVQIGRVSRVLKQNAIDCILNQKQTNFTIAKMNQKVKQILSDGKEIEYQIGDKPYSSVCDYMEKCSYECTPTKQIKPDDINSDSYGEPYLVMNTDRIKHRIRNLMKENYFYTKEELTNRIKILGFSSRQIEAALTELIDDKYEYIWDKYERRGNLINIGDLYLFQPIELNDTKISLFEREIPIAYKKNKVTINIPDKEDIVLDELDIKEEKADNIINNIETDYTIATTILTLKKKCK